MNIDKKRAEVETLFNDTLSLCKAMVKDAKQGKSVLRGSSLREVNQFLKFAQDYLARKQAEQERELQEQEEEDFELPEGAPRFPEDEGVEPKVEPEVKGASEGRSSATDWRPLNLDF
jgi:hypothetical protein